MMSESMSGGLDLERVLMRLLEDVRPLQSHHADFSAGFDTELWRALVDMGIPHGFDASQGSLEDMLTVARLMGRYAVMLPVTETILATWSLSAAGLPVEATGPLGFGPSRPGEVVECEKRSDGWRATGLFTSVPWARNAIGIVLHGRTSDGQATTLFAPAGTYLIREGENLAGEPRDSVELTGDVSLQGCEGDEILNAERALERGALLRAAMMSGAADGCVDLTARYAGVRQQFGKSIGSFQAVKHLLALIAEDQLCSSMGISLAEKSRFDSLQTADVALAKSGAEFAGDRVASIAHQIHGAIGVTAEYSLQLLTRRLWSWRHDYGGARFWTEALGRFCCDAGTDATWDWIVA